MNLHVHRRCSDYRSYRAARVKSLFNVESGCGLHLDAELPIDDAGWKIGVIVGRSGSGKSSPPTRSGRACRCTAGVAAQQADHRRDRPGGKFDDVAAALSAVGLGQRAVLASPVPRAEQRRAVPRQPRAADRARSRPAPSWTSSPPSSTGRSPASARSPSARRGGGPRGQVILCSCHYDVIDWLQPCWVFDTATGKYAGRGLWRRPPLELEIRQTNWRYWPMFEPHHYLKLPLMIAATNYVGTVGGELVAHVASRRGRD
jgi:hypothetical protein